MPTVVNSYRLPDGVTVFEYDDGSKAYVHYLIPVDEAGNVITGGGGGTGGAATIADGADIAEGSKADTAATDTTGPWTVISLLKGLLAAVKGTLAVTGTFWQAVQPVSGTFWQATQPVSVTSLPLPTGAAQDGTDATGVAAPAGATGIRGWLSSIYNKLNTSIAVTGTFWQAVQPVSGTVTANAGTNLNTSALATEAGHLATIDSVQGTTGDAAATTGTGGTSTIAALLRGIFNKLLGSIAVTGTFWQATQPVSGTVTANAGTNLNTSALAVESGGNLAASKVDLDTLAALFTTTSPARNVPANRTVTGNLTASGQTVAIDTTGMATVYFTYSGTFNGAIITEAFDGTAWITIPGYVLSSTQYVLNPNPLESSFSGNNKTSTTLINCAGFQQVQARCTSWTSGSAAVILNAATGRGFPTKLVGDEGNPVKADGNGALDVNILDLGGSAAGNALKVGGSSGNPLLANPSDSQAATDLLAVAPMQWDEINATWRKPRTTGGGTALVSAARTASAISGTLSNYGKTSMHVLIDVTARAAATTLRLALYEVFPGMPVKANAITGTLTIVAGHFAIVYFGAGFTAPALDGLLIMDASVAFGISVPQSFQLQVIPSDANSVTYSLTYLLT